MPSEMLVQIYEYTRRHVCKDGNFQEAAGSLKFLRFHIRIFPLIRGKFKISFPKLELGNCRTYDRNVDQ